MKWRILSLIVLFCAPLTAQQHVQDVRGKVIDDITENPLLGAEVFIKIGEQILGTTTDLNGEFTLDGVAVGRHTILARYLGYQDKAVPSVDVVTGKSVYVLVKMRESVETLEEVEVVGRIDKSRAINPSALVSTRTFSIEEASKFPGSFNDPARMAQSFAGAVNPDDQNNEIVIRGNSPRGVLWRLEGLEIPNPNHYRDQGGSGGAINIIPDVVLTNSDFFTGAFPSEYGNALSGVFDLRLRKGNNQQAKRSLQVGGLGVQAALEGPINKKKGSSYLFNYRYSTVTLLEAIGIQFTDEDEQAPVFQDAAMNISLPTAVGEFGIYGIWSRATAADIPIRDSLQWTSQSQRFTYQELYKTAILGVHHKLLLNKGYTSIRTALSYNNENDFEREFFIQDDYSDLLLYQDEYDYETVRFRTTLKHRFEKKWHGEAGIYLDRLGYRLNFSNRQSGELISFVDDADHSYLQRSYAQLLYRPSDNVTINGGLHQTYFFLNKEFIVEPRLAASWQVTDKLSVNAGSGLHSRVEAISLYLARNFDENGSSTQPNRDLGVTRSWHNVLGLNYRLSNFWNLKLEGYYQHLYTVPIFPTDFGGVSSLNFSSGFTNLKLESDGLGRNYGLELTLDKYMKQGHFMLLTGSLFMSEYQNTQGEWFNTQYNINYAMNFLTGKEWRVGKQKNNALTWSGRFIIHGGRRFIPIDEPASAQAGFIIENYSRAYEERIPYFQRIDMSLTYKKNKKKWSWSISLDIQNVLNRRNVLDRRYNLSSMQYFDRFQLGLIPVINYRVYF